MEDRKFNTSAPPASSSQMLSLLMERDNRLRLETKEMSGNVSWYFLVLIKINNYVKPHDNNLDDRRWHKLSEKVSVINFVHPFSSNEKEIYLMVTWDEKNNNYYMSSSDFMFIVQNYEPGIMITLKMVLYQWLYLRQVARNCIPLGCSRRWSPTWRVYIQSI